MKWKKREKTRSGISYCRKSIKPKGIENELDSILYQEKVIVEYCEYDNINLIEKYNDIGYSGKTQLRPELVEMLEFLESGEVLVDVILFYTVDRLGRDLVNNLDLVFRISKLVEEIVFVEEGMTSSSEYFKREIIQRSVQAEAERLSITKKLAGGKRAKAKYQGTFTGSTKPLGYIREEKTKMLVPATIQNTTDLREIQGLEAVKYIFLAYLSNVSLQQIAKQLNEQLGLTKRDANWEKNSVKYILNNAIYAGILESVIAGEKNVNTSANAQPIINKIIHKLIRLRLQNESSGRKSNYARLPIVSMTICVECLKPVQVLTSNKRICCPNCLRELQLDMYLKSVNESFIQYLEGKHSDSTVQTLLERKKSKLFMQIAVLKDELNELKGRRKLIESFFYDQKEYLNGMLKANQERKLELEEEMSFSVSLLDFLFDNPDVTLNQVLTFNQEDYLYLQLPFLAIVDFKHNLVKVKFHSEVFTYAGD